MLKNICLDVSMDKETYKQDVKPLREELSVLQHKVKDSGLPVMILFEGFSTAGKGSVLSDVILALDPRNFTSKSTLAPTVEEKRKPFLWRHWQTIPEKGFFTLYDRSWYPEVSSAVANEAVSKKDAAARMKEINVFERQLSEDGTLIIKFFLHISQKEQKKRMNTLKKDKSTAWRVSKEDYRKNKNYKKFLSAYDEMLTETNTPHAAWHVVAAHDRRACLAEIYRVIVNEISLALDKKASKSNAKNTKITSGEKFTLVQKSKLGEISLSQTMSDDEYKKRLKAGQKKLKDLHNLVYLQKIPIVIAYEGWDAAGKGGNIRRVAAGLDPRGYDVIPIAAPTPPEKNRHYLWRFWSHIPKDGHIAIFDRTWYGRVMVERIEGFATKEEWQRAYREINEFESQMHDWGAIILKYWIHIDKDEQLRRFESRKNTPEKQWKLTDEDWRNREKWPEYEEAVNDMIRLTSTDFAPWVIIESQNKRYARIKAIETLIEAIESRLN